MHIAIADKNGGIFKFNDRLWEVTLLIHESMLWYSIQHDHQGDLIYTDPQSHIVCISRNGRSETLAGIGTVGNRDGPTCTCKFGQPTGICIEIDSNVWWLSGTILWFCYHPCIFAFSLQLLTSLHTTLDLAIYIFPTFTPSPIAISPS